MLKIAATQKKKMAKKTSELNISTKIDWNYNKGNRYK